MPAGRGRGGGDPRRAAGRVGRPDSAAARRADDRPYHPAARPRISPYPQGDPVSTALEGLPDLDADAGSGIVARRAVIRWGWRLFRREWRQQLLMLGLLTVAVAATIWGASVITNAQLSNPNYATFGTAAEQVTLPGTDPHLAAGIATIAGRWGPADLIEKQNITTGTRQSVQLRAESPHGHYNSPLLSLVSGTYPAGPGQVALTSQVATRYGAHAGGIWHAAGTTWQVTGIVQDPSNLADEFALVAPGQLRQPTQAIMLLGQAAAQELLSDVTVPGVPAANVTLPTQQVSGVSPAVQILVVEVLGLAFVGLVSVASFSVMAQRRLRALGMLSAIGATERNLRLVMVTGGLAVGVAGALAGAALGFAAWFAYVPALQQAAGHVVDAANLPWWAFALGAVLAVATSVLASRRPAKTMARVPVVAALSGRPAPPKPVHRSALPGVIVFAAGVACLAFTGGLAGVAGQGHAGQLHALLLLAGLVAVIAGIVLLAPLAISVLAAGAGPRLPVAIRIALRDLVRYRARSGAALAATTFAVFLATVICLVASERSDNPLSPSGPSLSSSQLVVTAGRSPAPGMMMPLSSAEVASLSARLNSLAASLRAEQRLPGQPRDADGQQPAKRHLRAEHRDHRVRGAHVPPAGQPVRVADPGTCPAHRHADPRRATDRARLRGAGRDPVRRAGSRRDRRRRHRTRHRHRARRAGRVRRPDPQRDRAGPAHAHCGRRQRRDTADDHRGDRRRTGPARRDPRHGLRGDRRAGLGAQQPVRHVRRPAADRRADPAGRAAAGRRGRRLAAGRPRAAADRQAAD